MEENVQQEQQGKWYTLQVLSNQENKVRETLNRQLQLEDAVPVYEVCIPTGKVVEVRQGNRKTVERKMYPGYVFVRMDLYREDGIIDEKAWYFIKNVQGVISFMGGEHPLPLSDYELLSFPPPMGPEVNAVAVPAKTWKVGDRVVITEGAFEGSEGTIVVVDDERQRLTVEVEIFNRKTPAEVEFRQVEAAEA